MAVATAALQRLAGASLAASAAAAGKATLPVLAKAGKFGGLGIAGAATGAGISLLTGALTGESPGMGTMTGSTIGGLVGAIGGSFLGGPVGTIVGSALGSAVGSSIGEWIDNRNATGVRAKEKKKPTAATIAPSSLVPGVTPATVVPNAALLPGAAISTLNETATGEAKKQRAKDEKQVNITGEEVGSSDLLSVRGVTDLIGVGQKTNELLTVLVEKFAEEKTINLRVPTGLPSQYSYYSIKP